MEKELTKTFKEKNVETELIAATVQYMDKKLDEATGPLPQCHKTAKNFIRNAEGSAKAELHKDGTASVHFKKHPETGSSSEDMAAHVMRTFALGRKTDIKVGHKETQTGIHGTREFHLTTNDKGGHTVHIRPVSDEKLKR